MHLFMLFDNDAVIARDADDAISVWEESCDESFKDYADGGGDDVVMVPDDKPFTLRDEDDGVATKAAGAWAAELGRGFVGSYDF